MEKETGVSNESTGDYGTIGGWLILPAISLVLGGIFLVISVPINVGMIKDIPGRFQGMFLLSLLFDLIILVFIGFTANLFFGKKKAAPQAMINLMIMGLAFNGLLLLISLGSGAGPFTVEFGKALFKGTIGAAIWIPYFRRSERVKKTFIKP